MTGHKETVQATTLPPSKLSATIRLAIADGKTVDRQLYHANANGWHEYRCGLDVCEICLGGMLLAVSCRMPRTTSVGPGHLGNPRWASVVWAMESIRQHRLLDAYYEFYGKEPSEAMTEKLNAIPDPNETLADDAHFQSWEEFDCWTEELEYVAHMIEQAGA